MNFQEKYLREVLGLHSVVIPEGLEDSYPQHFGVQGDFEAPVAVVSFKPMSLPERELAQKMLKAVKVLTFLCIEFKATARMEDWDEFIGAYKGRALWFCGDIPDFCQAMKLAIPFVQLPCLSELVDESEPSLLMEKKKVVWEKLKHFHGGLLS